MTLEANKEKLDKDGLWLTWEIHRRSRVLAEKFGVPLVELTSSRKRIGRYWELSLSTLDVLRTRRPTILIVQNPSLFLAFLAVLLRPFLGYTLVVDRHSNFKLHEGALPRMTLAIFQWMSRFTIRKANLTIVTNEPLRELVESWGGRGEVLQDCVPDLSRPAKRLDNNFSLMAICSFADDEPIEELFDAAEELGNVCKIYCTGNSDRFVRSRRGKGQVSCPENVTLTGFVTEDAYLELLNAVNATIVLTKRENLLTCGAYESVSVGKPMLLSDTVAIKSYFSAGAMYTDNSAASICAKVGELIESKDRLAAECRELKVELEKNWAKRFGCVVRSIYAADMARRSTS